MLNSLPSSSTDVIDHQSLELRSRGSKNTMYRFQDDSPPPLNGSAHLNNRVLVEHVIRPGDTLNSIALQYSVQVAEIKRANGLVTDQEIFGLTIIRVPVSRLQREILFNNSTGSSQIPFSKLNAVQSGLSASSSVVPCDTITNFTNTTPAVMVSNQNIIGATPVAPICGPPRSTLHAVFPNQHHHYAMDSGETPLLQDYDGGSDNGEERGESGSDSAGGFETAASDPYGGGGFASGSLMGKKKRKKTKRAIENLLEKADATVAAVRENLSERSPNLEGGSAGFHFIDATEPDKTSKGIWLLVLSVVFMFVVVPLILTLMEEKSEEEQQLLHSHSQHQHHSHHGDASV